MTERTCGTCAWGTMNKDGLGNDIWALCHYGHCQITNAPDYWCRHWSATTGWDRFEEMPTPLENEAAEVFRVLLGDEHVRSIGADIERWLEEYKRKC